MLTAAQIHVEKIDSASNYTYGIYFTTAACRFWNDTSDTWDTAGCKVRPSLSHCYRLNTNYLFYYYAKMLTFVRPTVSAI